MTAPDWATVQFREIRHQCAERNLLGGSNAQLSLSSTGAQSLKVIKLNTVRGACKFPGLTRLLVPNVQAHGDTTLNRATVHVAAVTDYAVSGGPATCALTIEQDVIRVLSMTRQQRGHLYTEKDVLTMQTDADPIRTVTNAMPK